MYDDRRLPKKKFNKYPPEGITLEMKVRSLVEEYGWQRLGQKIYIRCFNENPSLKSSLKFLKTTEWARIEVENLYEWRFGQRNSEHEPDNYSNLSGHSDGYYDESN